MNSTRFAPPVRIALYVLLPLLAGSASPALAGPGIVNANQHKTDENLGCEYPPLPAYTCPESVNVPFQSLGNSGMVAANAYHVLAHCQALQARCEYKHLSRPKILSSDGCVNPQVVQAMIDDIENTSVPYHPLGSIHFEHFDRCLSKKATQGLPIADFSTFPDDTFCDADISSQDMLLWIQNDNGASPLEQNGLLLRGTGNLSDRLQWKVGSSATNRRLIGYGFMGAIAAGDRLDSREYLRTLREYNVNLTRVWSLEQWTGLAVTRDPGTSVTEGPTPFVGTRENSDYALFNPNPAFYSRLRSFAQNAADRGIVVQLSVFDKHGLVCDGAGDDGGYIDSPFRDLNNDQPFLENSIPGCSCGPGSCPWDIIAALESGGCSPLPSFVKTLSNPHFSQIRAMQTSYLRRVGEEVGGIGNMIYEVINEQRKDLDWMGDEDGDLTPDGTEWQIEMAKQIRLSLPLLNDTNLNVARDAFNGDANNTSIQSKPSDLAGMPWTSTNNNAQVILEFSETGGSGAPRMFGYATSKAVAGVSSMSASLPFGSSNAWTKVQVRADVAVASGSVVIGLASSAGHSMNISVDSSSNQITLYKIGNCPLRAPVCILGSASYSTPATWHNIRLMLEKVPATGLGIASVFVDGAPVTGLQAVDIGDVPVFNSAHFSGQNGSTPYPVDAGKVDSFEAARFCTETSQGCVP